MATRQRWYCGVCGAKYKTKFGLLMEIKHQGLGCYILADFPPQHMFDLKGAIIQQRFAEDLASPEKLYAILPDLKPASENFFKPILVGWKDGKSLTGHYSITNMAHLESLPRWSWGTVYQAPDIIEHGVEGAIQHSLNTGGDLLGTERLLVPVGPPGFPEAVTLQHPERS